MGWYFRKSVRLAKGVRLNFSKSGVGVSAGVKGFRVSTGPRGTYVNIGGGGVYYRQKIGSVSNPSQPNFSQGDAFPSNQQPIPDNPILSANAVQLLDSTSAATLNCLNERLASPTYAAVFAMFGTVAAVVAALVHPIVAILTAGLGAYLTYLAYQFDIERRTQAIEYEFDDESRQRWIALNHSLMQLARSQRVWQMHGFDHTWDWKRNGGASQLWTRGDASVVQQAAPCIRANITPYCLIAGSQRLCFLPDRLYIYQDGRYGAVDYSNLALGLHSVDFIESSGVPGDSQVVGNTWLYVNKNGTPDRRFNNNRQLPIARYGAVTVKSGTGLNLLFYVSSVSSASSFVSEFMSLGQKPQAQRSAPNAGQSRSNTSNTSHQSKQNSQQSRSSSSNNTNTGSSNYQRPQQPKPVPTSSWTQVLGLSANCTREEADARFKHLVMQYHPDRVAHMAPEFKLLAEEKMKAINSACTEMKRERGW